MRLFVIGEKGTIEAAQDVLNGVRKTTEELDAAKDFYGCDAAGNYNAGLIIPTEFPGKEEPDAEYLAGSECLEVTPDQAALLRKVCGHLAV